VSNLNGCFIQHVKDSQVLLAQGNFHLGAANRRLDDGVALKTSYKFFFPILSDHKHNPYAAQGLGIVCALKGELAASDAIFSKVDGAFEVADVVFIAIITFYFLQLRQVQVSKLFSDNLDLNLAYVHHQQKRYPESERHVFAALRNMSKTASPADFAMCLKLHSVMQNQVGQHQDSFRSSLKSLHLNAAEAIYVFKTKKDGKSVRHS
jgi:hypothetical protein